MGAGTIGFKTAQTITATAAADPELGGGGRSTRTAHPGSGHHRLQVHGGGVIYPKGTASNGGVGSSRALRQPRPRGRAPGRSLSPSEVTSLS